MNLRVVCYEALFKQKLNNTGTMCHFLRGNWLKSDGTVTMSREMTTGFAIKTPRTRFQIPGQEHLSCVTLRKVSDSLSLPFLIY